MYTTLSRIFFGDFGLLVEKNWHAPFGYCLVWFDTRTNAVIRMSKTYICDQTVFDAYDAFIAEYCDDSARYDDYCDSFVS